MRGRYPPLAMSSVSKLARTLGGSDLGQDEARHAFLLEAQTLVVNQDWTLSQRAIALLEAAMALTRLLEESSTKEASAMDAMVRRLVSFAKVEADKPQQAPPTIRPASREEYEKLEDGVERSVGSILVRMGEVTPDEVERAGDLRLAGEKLGQALVRRGEVPDEV